MSNARIATVTSVNPYQVQLLGASAPLNVAPVVLDTVNVGDYVWCEFFDQQLVVQGRIQDGAVPQLGSTEDLNSFVYTGKWNQPLTANTSLAHNYPVLFAGLLEVVRAETNGSMIHQTYSAYNGSARYWRTYYNTGWLPWQVYGGHGAWINLSLQNSWVAYGGGYNTPQFKVDDGKVYLRGMVKNGTSTTVATLPVGARPIATRLCSTTTSPNVFQRVDVSSSGAILLASGYSTAWVSLDGITPFDAEQ